MGAGASSVQRLNMKKERRDEAEARKLFKELANGETLGCEEILASAEKYGKATKAYWTLETIERKLALYDADGDGRITEDEYLAALGDMQDRSAEETVSEHAAKLIKKKKKGGSSSKDAGSSSGSVREGEDAVKEVPAKSPALKRQWTWKKFETPANQQSDLDKALAELDEVTAAAPKDYDALAAAFWQAQNESHDGCWTVPLRRDRNKMPWLAEGETGMLAAIAQAKKEGKTPLLLEEDLNQKPVESHYMRRQTEGKAMFMHANKFLAWEKLVGKGPEGKTHEEILKEERVQFVECMRRGKTLFIQLSGTVVDFTGGKEANAYAEETFFPIEAFDQRLIAKALESFSGDLAERRAAMEADANCHLSPSSYKGLVDGPHPDTPEAVNSHPFAKCLRDTDPDMATGAFMICEGFEVVISTQLKRSDFVSMLRSSLPWARLQPILLTTIGD